MNYLEGVMEERLAAHEMELFGHMCQPSNQPKSTKAFFTQFRNYFKQNQPNRGHFHWPNNPHKPRENVIGNYWRKKHVWFVSRGPREILRLEGMKYIPRPSALKMVF